MSQPATTTSALSIDGLTITLPNGRRLLDNASLEVKTGEFVLLAGRSGTGKSTLLRLIAGLDDDPQDALGIKGSIKIADSGQSMRPRVGIVFQNHALFDELSAIGNVQFALDHGDRNGSEATAADLLKQLGVPLSTDLSRLSGGERQRVAVARTLAYDPPILLFDEPTTGLDPARARDVAALIADTHRQSNKTVVVVTHDVAPFLPLDPRLVLLDGQTGSLRDITPDELTRHFASEAIEPIARLSVHADARPARGVAWLESPGEVVWMLLASVAAAMGGWRRSKWKLRYLWHYARMVCLGTTAVYVVMAGAMLGFVFTSFSFSQLPYAKITVPLLTEEFLAATGYATYRVIVPLLIAVLLAGKCGAAVAADVGARRLTHQFDAARSFGAEPQHYWFGNIVVAFVIAAPALTLLAFAANWVASLVAFLMSSESATINVFLRNFLATVRPPGRLLPIGTGWVIAKAAISGLLIGTIAYTLGARRKSSSTDVSAGVGRTIFWSSLAVLAFHSILSFVEF